MSLPFITVVVPTYRRPVQLAALLDALARQDYPRASFEVVVVDDGSERAPEREVEVAARAIDARLVVQPHAGPSAARNRAARLARGEYLAFTDDDCAPEPAWLTALARRLVETPPRVVGGRTVNALERNLCAATSQLTTEVVYEYYNPDPSAARFFASNNLAAPAREFREAGGFDERYHWAEDRDFCDRWRARGFGMTYAPDAVVRHAHHLSPRTLWRQHFGYGRGAWNFHRGRKLRGAAEGFRPDLAFYRKLLTAPLSERPLGRAATLAALVVWSQAANTAGFIYERARAARGADAHGRGARQD
ncbi:MAG TPA: glycosyltransferase [Pyrinomonadaceae bacterium]|nr:glycosyltransferase [Pyrinomonadaceae bacterium]